ncbi:MAG: PAS domain S-box protein, partial [Gammaproteobacteria bacterium]|nr:PAS domain S-box protein [Gammaproteobacteria bacterium]
MKPGTTLVSKTDLKGATTYANSEFVEICGYSEDELLGRNHNIVRHPDMPPAAFQDLWDTIKAGRPWVGIVKNRCKNGDFYWVKANVIPVIKDGTIEEYLSVRQPPSRDEIEQAGALYVKMNAGRVPKKSLPARIYSVLTGMTLKRRTQSMLAVMGLSFAILAAIIWLPANTTNNIWDDYQAQVTERLNLISEIKSQIGFGGAIHNFKNYVLRGTPKYADRFRKNHALTGEKIKEYAALPQLTGAEQEALNAIQGVIDEYNINLDKVEPMVASGATAAEIDGVVKISDSPAIKGLQVLHEHVGTLTASGTGKLNQNLQQSEVIAYTVPLAFFVLLGGFLLWNLYRGMLTPINEVVDKVRVLTEGNFSDEIAVDTKGEIGDLLRGLKQMQVKIGFEIMARKQAEAGQRIKTALDSVGASVMLADVDMNIIYMNNAVTKMMKDAESKLRESLPGFDADKLIGANIDSFHKNPSHQR